MIKYKNELKKFIVIKNNHPHGDEAYDFEVLEADPKDLITFIRSLLLRQIDEDNERFLGMIGEDEKQQPDIIYDLLQDSRDFISFGKTNGRNELRAELRDKVNKK